jgi:L-lactate dehydrogenase (cytochrome)
LDQAPLPLALLPDVVDAIGSNAAVFLDSGVLRGADIVAAVALGATAVLVGRCYLYGLMAGGERGVDKALDILSAEIERTLALLGVRSLDDLDPAQVALGHAPDPARPDLLRPPLGRHERGQDRHPARDA